MYIHNTTFEIENKEEFVWLMQHLEDLGYLWMSGDSPSNYNGMPTYYTQRYLSTIRDRICLGTRTPYKLHITVASLRNSKRPSIFRSNHGNS